MKKRLSEALRLARLERATYGSVIFGDVVILYTSNQTTVPISIVLPTHP